MAAGHVPKQAGIACLPVPSSFPVTAFSSTSLPNIWMHRVEMHGLPAHHLIRVFRLLHAGPFVSVPLCREGSRLSLSAVNIPVLRTCHLFALTKARSDVAGNYRPAPWTFLGRVMFL